nr:MAG TPA: hypothetical protein [Bacteriophage sp.]DAW98736.1 MAG TPA: hypothetical protein [Caudoviricetes sp.]DAX15040.1 MAG TPA: hypothetical protein [Bacteriophage sp.]
MEETYFLRKSYRNSWLEYVQINSYRIINK